MTNSYRWNRIQELFESALSISPEKRATYLEKECGSDSELISEVLSLIAADNETHPLLDRSAFDLLDLATEILHEGNQIGPYRILRQIGIGGMGAVYLAERADGHFEQQVALKIIKPGMDSQEILKRFRRERQILAQLNHPHIASLLDGGITERGFPYFTLEYIDGQPIDEYCDAQQLSISERLSLFSKVCEAVQHAHQNLVIHRDLKPSNILITADGTVKLLDFGIASVLSQEDNQSFTLLTGDGRQVMTPEYASPEQVRGEHINTASDIYSLGIILYELLTGQRPYTLTSRSQMEIEKIVCGNQPLKPSSMVIKPRTQNKRTEDITKIADNRKTIPEKLLRSLKGDLDNICLKALNKAAEKRYVSADQFLQDIHRFRNGLPVNARPLTLVYRLQKFTNRHRLALVSGIAVLLVLIGLISFYTAQLSEERDIARLEAQKTAQIASFMTDIFKISDPKEAGGETVTARELLDRGSERIEDELEDQPQLKAMMFEVVGEVYGNLGLYKEARFHYEKALSELEKIHQEPHAETAVLLTKLGTILISQRKDSLAESTLRRALEIQQNIFGEAAPELAQIYSALGRLYNVRADYDQAMDYFQRSLFLYKKSPESSKEAMSTMINDLALLYHEKGDYETAEEYYKQALGIQLEIFGPVHPEVATTKYNYSQLLWDVGRYEQSEKLKREVVELDRQILGNFHPDLAYSLANLAKMLKAYGKLDSSEALFREAHQLRIKTLGENHPQVIYSLNELGGILFLKEKFSEAEQMHRDALKLATKSWPGPHPEIARSYRHLGRALLAQSKTEDARQCFNRAIEINRKALGDNHPYLAFSLIDMARFLQEVGEFDTVRSLYKKAINIYTNNYGETHPAIASAYNLLSQYFLKTNQVDSAEVYYSRALEMVRQKFPPLHPELGAPLMGLGNIYLIRGDARRAEPLLREGLRIRTLRLPEGHSIIALGQSLLGESLARQDKSEEARFLLTAGYEGLKERYGEDNALVRDARNRLKLLEHQ